MLGLMRAEAHYPHSMVTKEWCGMYFLEYGEKLATKDAVYKRVKKTFEHDKEAWRKKNPKGEEALRDAVETMKLNPYYAEATRETLLKMIYAQRKALGEGLAARAVA